MQFETSHQIILGLTGNKQFLLRCGDYLNKGLKEHAGNTLLLLVAIPLGYQSFVWTLDDGSDHYHPCPCSCMVATFILNEI